jgi:WD40-like Beta Propeller Repeat
MTDLDDRLRRAAQAVRERVAEEVAPEPRLAAARRRSRPAVAAVVVASVIVLGAVALTTTPGAPRRLATAPPPMPSLIVAWANDGGLVVLSSDTGAVVRTLDSGVTVTRALPAITVAPDGSTVYYSRSRQPHPGECSAGGVDEIARVSLAGSVPVSVAPGVYPTISPDGRYLAYTRNTTNPCNTDHDELVVVNLQSGVPTTLRSTQPHGDLSFLSWAPDSAHLGYYYSTDGHPAPLLIDVTTATSLDQATPIRHAPDTNWGGFLGTTGTSFGVIPNNAGHPTSTQVVQLDDTTGAILRSLFSLPGGLDTSNALDGPEDALRADNTGRHVLALGLLPLGAPVEHGALYQWTEGDLSPHLLADGIDRALWVPNAAADSTPSSAGAGLVARWSHLPTDASLFPNGTSVNDVIGWHGRLFAVGDIFGAHVAYGAEPAVWTSPDGTNWTKVWDSGGIQLGSATQQRLIVVASRLLLFDYGTAGTLLWQTTDGTSWRRTPLAWEQAPMVDIAQAGTQLVAIVYDKRGVYQVWTSVDGTAWRLSTFDFGAHRFEAITVADGAFLIGGSDDPNDMVGHPTVWYSPDGSSWGKTVLTTKARGTVTAVGANSRSMVAAAFDGKQTSMWASAGRPWIPASISGPPPGRISRIITTPKGFVAIPADNAALLSSATAPADSGGFAWDATPSTPAQLSYLTAATLHGNGLLVFAQQADGEQPWQIDLSH